MTNSIIMFFLIVVPLIAGLAVLVVRSERFRTPIVWVMAALLIGGVAALYRRVPFTYTPGGSTAAWNEAVIIADLVLSVCAFGFGAWLRDRAIMALAALQAAVMLLFDVLVRPEVVGPVFVVDWLSLIVALLVCVVGSLIAIYATGYMREHEAHLGLARSRQPRFFAILLAFIGVMNALVFANQLPWLFLAWEGTTLASFLLISHDGTDEAKRSGARALRINMLGGLAMTLGIVLVYHSYGTLSLAAITRHSIGGAAAMLAVSLFAVAAMTKAAQMPFQSWLLGAMVAPTPVSALLHSSTMVKAGVYFLIRLAPAFRGTRVASVIGLLGALTFACTSALAFSQSNAKKVLAYSTIANLGLIIACAGVGTPLAIGAAMALMLFHGISKALLFLCVGTIEQHIGSRDIEDMEGLIDRMPFTTLVAIVGMLSVLLPPFGVLISKWAVMEAAARMPVNIMLIALGSALTLAFWTKWMARLLASAYKENLKAETMAGSKRLPLIMLGAMVLVLSFGVGVVMNKLIAPAERAAYGLGLVGLRDVEVVSRVGTFLIWPAAVGLAMMVLAFFVLIWRSRSMLVVGPYLCGENMAMDEDSFRGEYDSRQPVVISGVYLPATLGEDRLGRVANWAAVAGIILLFGVVL